LLALG